ncbi:hydroxyacid dehydrogenase [Streptomyces justiciae]|uniref:hydroxyacid dehydrogenase n=1 Tax=Streptomyces justiciae TaxID=2780140 RepID=UPI001880CE02|nr:hydroxyacid dehydrogenase [Streptomyces justiciae]MBE8472289.1 hydroxyacid dehydrogenase [Streptomyces justiciae]
MASTRRPGAAVVLSPTLRDEVFGPTAWAELTGLVELLACCSHGDDLAAHPRRGEVEVLVTSWGAPPLTTELLAELPRLRTVLHAAGSVRRIAGDAVWERGITVVSAADANNEPVAEYVYAQTILALKDVHRRSRRIVTDRAMPPMEDVPGIREQTVGLVSFGSVARKTAQRLRRLDTEILAWDPYLDDEVFAVEGVTRVAELPELVARSRVLSIHTPLIRGRTENLVGGDLLRLLPRRATLVNTARGAVIDEAALIRVLAERPDLFAVLDVTAVEPPEPQSGLYTLPNVLLTGHVAGTVGTERRALGRLVIDELRRLTTGLPLLHTVSAASAHLRA